MKKLAFIAIAAAALFSCKKDNNSKTQAVSIVGKWKYQSQHDEVTNADGTVFSNDTTTVFPSGAYLQFNADATGEALDGAGSEFDFSYSITGNTETEYQLPRTTGDGPYNIFTVSFTAKTLTRHSEGTTGDGKKESYDEVLTR